MNGLTLSQYRELFGKEPKNLIKTNAGSGLMRIKLVPWVMLEHEKDLKKMPKFINEMVQSMAMFQRWIYESKNNHQCLREIIANTKVYEI